MKYCKWHNATSHDTNECKIFRQQIQSAIEQGRLKFEIPTKPAKPMKIDQHPFPTNMVDASKNPLQTKMLTSESAKRSGAVDPRNQVTSEDIKGKRRMEADDGEPERPRITSQFLLQKYQRQHERSRSREEAMRRHEEHWRCPFFIHCWENNLRLPSADTCPECSGPYQSNRPFTRSRSRDGRPEPISRNQRNPDDQRPSMRDRLGGRSDRYDRSESRSHNRQGGRTDRHDQSNSKASVHSRLEDMADARVTDENSLGREPEWERAGKEGRPINPRWCPDGLTKSQKRRIQRLRQWEQQEEESAMDKKEGRPRVWRPKRNDKGNNESAGDESAAEINMVFILPMEFMTPADQQDVSAIEEQTARLVLEPMTATFEKPEDDERQHMKALFLKGHVDGRPLTKLMVDGGAAVNIMPYAVLRKLGKSDDDLTRTDMMLKDFEGKVSNARGALCVDLTIGSKTLPTTFFVINGKGSYNMLLGRDWIHANCCIPSTMHQCLVQWIGDNIEVVKADSAYSIAAADAQHWSCETVKCISGRVWETDFLKVTDFGLQPIRAVGSEEAQ